MRETLPARSPRRTQEFLNSVQLRWTGYDNRCFTVVVSRRVRSLETCRQTLPRPGSFLPTTTLYLRGGLRMYATSSSIGVFHLVIDAANPTSTLCGLRVVPIVIDRPATSE